jgi:hypothetical protein
VQSKTKVSETKSLNYGLKYEHLSLEIVIFLIFLTASWWDSRNFAATTVLNFLLDDSPASSPSSSFQSSSSSSSSSSFSGRLPQLVSQSRGMIPLCLPILHRYADTGLMGIHAVTPPPLAGRALQLVAEQWKSLSLSVCVDLFIQHKLIGLFRFST